MLLAIPLMIIPFILYNLVAFGFLGSAGEGDPFGAPVFSIDMISGASFGLDTGDLVILIALVLLFLEILKATRTGTGSIIDHLLSTVVFIIYLVEFLLVKVAATPVFFIVTAMALIDVIAGYSVTIRAARRDFTVGSGGNL